MDNRLDIDRGSYTVRSHGPRPVNGSLNAHHHPAESVKPSSGLSIIALEAFMTQQLAPREMVLDPIIAVRSLVFSLPIAASARRWSPSTSPGPSPVAGVFLRWSSPKPRRVLYVDGEMPQQLLQERARTMIEGSNVRPPAPSTFASCRSTARSSARRSIWLRREHQVEIEKLLDTGNRVHRLRQHLDPGEWRAGE